MGIISRTILKSKFLTGLFPSESDFHNWLDSFWHKEDDQIPTTAIDGLDTALANKANVQHNQLAETITDFEEAVLEVVPPGNVTSSTDLDDMPPSFTGEAGKKLVVKQDETGYELIAASTIQGFNDKEAQVLTFVDNTRTLYIDPVAADFKITNKSGVEYIKTQETIQITDTEGLHMIYYDIAGALQVSVNPNRSLIYDLSKENIVVSFVFWSVQDSRNSFVTEVLKGRDMNNTTFTKNFFDKEIYPITGITQFSDPSNGGTVIESGDLDEHAQFGIAEGKTIWTDSQYHSPIRSVGADWNVYYLDNNKLRYFTKPAFAILNDTDLAIDVTGRVLYNNGSSPLPVPSSNHVWYFVGVSNDINQNEKRLVSFMGQNQYGSRTSARNNIENEIATVEDSFGIRQEFKLIYAVLYQTHTSSYTNTVKARIVDFQAIRDSSGGQPVSSIPDELVNGSNADAFHKHSHDILDNIPVAATGVSAGHVDNSQALQIPELTTAERDAIIAPNAGMVVYNTTIGVLEYYTGSEWLVLVLGSISKVFDANAVFNAAKFELFDMPITGNTTLTLQNKIPGKSYAIELRADGTAGHSVSFDPSFGTVTDNSIQAITPTIANAKYIVNVLVYKNGNTYYNIETIGA